MSEYRVGDRVRVTFEAEVVGDGAPSSACLCSFEYGNHYRGGAKIRETYLRQEGVEVEKTDPPVETFKPGDVVRHTAHIYALTPTGFVVLDQGIFYTYGEGGRYQAEDFTSDVFERVDIS